MIEVIINYAITLMRRTGLRQQAAKKFNLGHRDMSHLIFELPLHIHWLEAKYTPTGSAGRRFEAGPESPGERVNVRYPPNAHRPTKVPGPSTIGRTAEKTGGPGAVTSAKGRGGWQWVVSREEPRGKERPLNKSRY